MVAIINSKKLDFARSIIKKEKIFTINKLVSILECSSRTAQAKLKLWKAYTSYNQNGKYYALPEIPHLNDYGLWRFKKAAFSKHGNLKKTIVYLVSSAPDGLTGRQIGEILGLSPQSFLHHFRKSPGIYRKKHDGVYVYFSDDTSVSKHKYRKGSPLSVDMLLLLFRTLRRLKSWLPSSSNTADQQKTFCPCRKLKKVN